MFPSDTLNPANSMIASLGMGMQALSRVMSTNTPARPSESMTLVAAVTSGSKMSAGTGGQHYTRAGGPPKGPSTGPCVQAPRPAVRGRRGARCGGVRTRVRAAVPGRADWDPASVRDDARRVDRLRRDRQGDRVRGPGPPPQVVALFPAPRHVAGREGICGGEHDPRRGLHAGEAVRLQPSSLRRRLRPAAHDPAGGRRAERPDKATRGARTRGVLIIGAGSGGQMVVRELKLNPDLGVRAIGFVDDDPGKRDMTASGAKVLGSTDEIAEILDRESPDEVVIAIPSAPGVLRAKVVVAC